MFLKLLSVVNIIISSISSIYLFVLTQNSIVAMFTSLELEERVEINRVKSKFKCKVLYSRLML